MAMKYLLLFFWAFFIACAKPAYALSVIRDAEIEENVTGWLKSIFRVVKLPPENAEIVLVNDPSINAFVAGGQTIFIHTGLLTNATSLDDVMFVLSHETGHIVGGHIIRGITAMERAQTTTLISTILGGVLAVISGRPDAGIAIMIGSQGSALGQFLAYRQTEESSADRTAVDVMKQLGYSMQGFTNIMKKLKHLERLNDNSESSYMRTHPMTQNRMRDLDRFTQNAPVTKRSSTFERIKAKLIGFMEKPQDVLAYYKGNSLIDRYAQSIALYRKHELDKSFKLLDELIKENPNDAYLHELRGQFSFEKGFADKAIYHYEQANKLKPNQPLIELALAQSYLEKKNKTYAQKALPILRQATLDEPNLAFGWRLMATAYDRLDQDLEADYAMVEYERTSGKLPAAQKRAQKLLEKLDKNTPFAQRLQDIIALKGKEED